MADEDTNRQRMEDMLKSDEQRPSGGAVAEDDRDEHAGPGQPAEQASPPEHGDAGGDPQRAAKLAKAGTIAGAISIPGALFPIVGVLLGVAAIVLGVMAGRAAAGKHGKLAVGLGGAGVVLALVIFAIALATA